jgi:lantibiotic modifying enzyme
MAPGHFDDPVLNLYSGTPGVILFLLELHHATGQEAYLRDAEAGASHLMAAYLQGPAGALRDGSVGHQEPAPADGSSFADPGLYTGMAGAAYTLGEVYAAGGDGRFREGALTLVDRIVASARAVDSGLLWFADGPDQASYDVISGSSGIGLTLLYAHDRMGHRHALDAAARVGSVLQTKGRPTPTGLKWPMSEAYPRLMPNFSHGTAGVVYFLARLSEATGRADFLDQAVDGAGYLEAASMCGRDGCLLFHHEPEGEDLFYLSWCHGPVGTARAFHQLAAVTGEEDFTEWLRRGGKAIRDLGVPENRTPGYWNNVSQCCGDAGVGDFFLSLHALDPDAGHDRFAWRVAEYLVAQGTEDSLGSRWIQAEHRTRPDYVMAQTGWMQGAAGVGAFLLHLDGLEKGRPARIVFPDSPWRGMI